MKSISHRCYIWEVAPEWELAKEAIYLPLGCLQGGADLDSETTWLPTELVESRILFTLTAMLVTLFGQTCSAERLAASVSSAAREARRAESYRTRESFTCFGVGGSELESF